MHKKPGLLLWVGGCFAFLFFFPVGVRAQQTLGGITGLVTDISGGAVAETQVTLVADGTKLTRRQKTNTVGTYDFVSLPIGTYKLSFSHDGFETQNTAITVQADRTLTVNATLKIGQVGTTVRVEASPLLNFEDTANGYILEKESIESTPLSTGSFTGLAILQFVIDSRTFELSAELMAFPSPPKLAF